MQGHLRASVRRLAEAAWRLANYLNGTGAAMRGRPIPMALRPEDYRMAHDPLYR